MTDGNCEGFRICDDRITENDWCVIKIIGIHWWETLNVYKTLFVKHLLHLLLCLHDILRLVNTLMTKKYITLTGLSLLFIRPSSDGTYYGMVMSVRPGLHPTPSVRPTLRPTLRPSGSPSARFPHFSLTCFDTLSWNFAHDFVLMYYRSSSSVVNLRQFWRSYGSLELRI